MKHIKNYLIFESEFKPSVKKHQINGFTIYQGKNAKSNDYITFDLSEDDDIWMHAKGVPGSHILIKVNDKIPMEDTIKEAAIIAVKNSKSKSPETVVVWCKKKFVSKDDGMNDGQVKVDYKNANEIVIYTNKN